MYFQYIWTKICSCYMHENILWDQISLPLIAQQKCPRREENFALFALKLTGSWTILACTKMQIINK